MKRIPPHTLAAIAQKYGCDQLVIWMRGTSAGRKLKGKGMTHYCVAYGMTADDQSVAEQIASLLRNRDFTATDPKRVPHELTWHGRRSRE